MTTGPSEQYPTGGYAAGDGGRAYGDAGWGYPSARTAVVPEYWLDSGPPLPRRSWQRRSRVWVIVGSSIGVAVFAAVAVLALLVGLLISSRFEAKGSVPVDCSTRTAQGANGVVAEGTPVVIFDPSGKRVASTTLKGTERHGGQCALPFAISGLHSTGGFYLVQVGQVFAQTVSQDALRSGVILRPI